MAEAIQIQLAKGLAGGWHQPGKIQPALTMAVQAPVAQAEIAMALLELLPCMKIGPQNPRIAPGGGGSQGSGQS